MSLGRRGRWRGRWRSLTLGDTHESRIREILPVAALVHELPNVGHVTAVERQHAVSSSRERPPRAGAPGEEEPTPGMGPRTRAQQEGVVYAAPGLQRGGGGGPAGRAPAGGVSAS